MRLAILLVATTSVATAQVDYCVAPTTTSSTRTYQSVATDLGTWSGNITNLKAQIRGYNTCRIDVEEQIRDSMKAAGLTYHGNYASLVPTAAQKQYLTDATAEWTAASTLKGEIDTHRSNLVTLESEATGEVYDLKRLQNLEQQKQTQGLQYQSRLPTYKTSGPGVSPVTYDWASLKGSFDTDWSNADALTSGLQGNKTTAFSDWDGEKSSLSSLLSAIDKSPYLTSTSPTQAMLNTYNSNVDAYNDKVALVDSYEAIYATALDAYNANVNLKLAIDDIRNTVHGNQQSWQTNYDAYPAAVQSETADSFYVRSNTNFVEKEATLKSQILAWLPKQVAYDSYVAGLAGSPEDPNNVAVTDKDSAVLTLEGQLLYANRNEIAWTINYLTSVASSAVANQSTYASPGTNTTLGPTWFQQFMLDEANNFQDFDSTRQNALRAILDSVIDSSRQSSSGTYTQDQTDAGTYFDGNQTARVDAVATSGPANNLYNTWQSKVSDKTTKNTALTTATTAYNKILTPEVYRTEQAALVATKVAAIVTEQAGANDPSVISGLESERDTAAGLVRSLSIPSWVSSEVGTRNVTKNTAQSQYNTAVTDERTARINYELGTLDEVRFVDSSTFNSRKQGFINAYTTPISTANTNCQAATLTWSNLDQRVNGITTASGNVQSLKTPYDTKYSDLTSQSCTSTVFYTEALNKLTTIRSDYQDDIDVIDEPLANYAGAGDIGFMDVGLTDQLANALVNKNNVCQIETDLKAERTLFQNKVLGSTRQQDINAVTLTYTDWGLVGSNWAAFYPSQYVDPHPVSSCTVDNYTQYKNLRQLLWNDPYDNQKRLNWEGCTGILVTAQAFGPDVTSYLSTTVDVTLANNNYNNKVQAITDDKSHIITKIGQERIERQSHLDNLSNYNTEVKAWNLLAEEAVHCMIKESTDKASITTNMNNIVTDTILQADLYRDYWATEQSTFNSDKVDKQNNDVTPAKDKLGYNGVAYDSTYFNIQTASITSTSRRLSSESSEVSREARRALGATVTIDDFQILPKLNATDAPQMMKICTDSAVSTGSVVGALMYYGQAYQAPKEWIAGGLHGVLPNLDTINCNDITLSSSPVSQVNIYTSPTGSSPTAWNAITVSLADGSTFTEGVVPTSNFDDNLYTFSTTGTSEFFGFTSDVDDTTGAFVAYPQCLQYDSSFLNSTIVDLAIYEQELDLLTRQEQAAIDSAREWQEIAIYNHVIAVDLWTNIPAAVPTSTYVVRQEEVTKVDADLIQQQADVTSEQAWGLKEKQRATERTQYNADVAAKNVKDASNSDQTTIDSTWTAYTSATAIEHSNNLITLERTLTEAHNTRVSDKNARHAEDVATRRALLAATVKGYHQAIADILDIPYDTSCVDDCIDLVEIKALAKERETHTHDEDDSNGGAIAAAVIGAILLLVLVILATRQCMGMGMGGQKQKGVSREGRIIVRSSSQTPEV